LRGIADDAVRRTKATGLRGVIGTLQTAQQSAGPADWAGKSPAAFVSALHPILADVHLLAAGLDAQAVLQAQRATAHERLVGLHHRSMPHIGRRKAHTSPIWRRRSCTREPHRGARADLAEQPARITVVAAHSPPSNSRFVSLSVVTLRW
jgi:hypothetical protein